MRTSEKNSRAYSPSIFQLLLELSSAESGLGRGVGSRQQQLVCLSVMLRTSLTWERHHGLRCTVNRRMFHGSEHSDAGHLCISIQTDERRESILPALSWRSTAGLSPTPVHGRSSFQRRIFHGLLTKLSLMNTSSLLARHQLLTSSARTGQQMSCIKQHL
jgi:hypothetical protein